MSSAITNKFRGLLLDLLKGDLDSSSPNYYIGLSRADAFTAPDPINSPYAQSQIRHSLQAVKTVSNSSFVIPTVNWETSTIYETYDNADPDQTNFYVINAAKQVFICIEQGKSTDGIAQVSTVEPSVTDGSTFRTTDGYKWRFMYKISNVAYSTYRTAVYSPVKNIIDNTSFILEEIAQKALQDAAVPGEIIGLAIDSTGTAIPSIPVITIQGNGTGAQFTCSVTNGKITRVQVDSDVDGLFTHGTGYDYATAKLSVGDAVLRPIFSPRTGLHADLPHTFKSKALMIQQDFVDDEQGTLLVDNDFSQIALFRGVTKYGSDSAFTGNTGIALKSFTLDSAGLSGTFDEDAVFENGAQTSQGKVLHFDTAINRLYYWQDESTGFNTFQTLGTATQTTGGVSAGNGQILSIINPAVDAYSGDILYINNVSSIDRASNQTEDIRIVIQLG